MCESKICNKCNELKLDDHECIPGNIASMELINKDTKPCPNCATMIFKISGCDQMYCTECHTAFSWNRGTIEAGVVHNPHYYEYMRTHGGLARAPGDIPCGGLPDYYNVNSILRKLKLSATVNSNISNLHRVVSHIQRVEIREVQVYDESSNRNMRVSFLLNKLSETDFKKILYQKEKKNQKSREFNSIYQMFTEVCSDIFRQMLITPNEKFRVVKSTETYDTEPWF